MKQDRIFYAACALSAVGVLLAILGTDYSLVLFVAAYLLRPMLVEFGQDGALTDERERAIHSRSGNLAFVVMTIAAVGLAMEQIAQGKRPEEMYELIAIGLAARALTGPIMVGEFRKAGVLIISAVGFFLGLFIVLEASLSLASIAGVVIMLLIVGVGQIARRFPRTIAVLLAAIGLSTIFFFRLYDFRLVQTSLWLFFVTPVATASVCLFLGSGKEPDVVSRKARSIAFGSLATGAAIVFTLLMIFGSREELPAITSKNLDKGTVTYIQGVPCQGYVNYYQNGKLQSCILAREDTLLGQPFPAGTRISFAADGTLDRCFFPHNVQIQGVNCKGTGIDGYQMLFYPNGKLRLAWLAQDQEIQGVPCMEASFWADAFGGGVGVSFHDNGILARCKLSQNCIMQGRSFKRGQHVSFDNQGHIVAKP